MKSLRRARTGRLLHALWLAAVLFSAWSPAAVLAQQATPDAALDPAATRQYAAAVALQNREQFELAIDEWRAFLTRHAADPRADRATHYLGVCHLKANQLPQAVTAFGQAIAKYPESELLPASYLYLGIAQYNQAQGGQAAQFDVAAKTFAALLSKYAESDQAPQAMYYLGECLYATGKKQEAATLYAELAAKHADDPLAADALYALGATQDELGKPDEAARTYLAFLAKHADHRLATEVKLRHGETLMTSGKYAEAAARFAEAAAVEDFALADHATMRQAASLYEQQEYDRAAALYASVPRKFPQTQFAPAAHLAAGKCAYLAGKYDQARAYLAKLTGGGAQATEAAHWIVRSLLKQNRPPDALATAERALSAAEGEYATQIELDLADALYEIPQRRDESIARYAALADAHPQDALAPQALYMAAFASLGEGKYQAALAHAGKFLRAYADHSLATDVTYVAAESYVQLNDFEKAAALYDRLLSSHAEHADAPTWRLRKGLCLFHGQKHAETIAALEPLLSTLSAAEQQAEAHFLIGSSRHELKDYPAAVKSLTASLAAAPRWRQADDVMLVLADALDKSGHRDDAARVLEKLVESSPDSGSLDRALYRLGEAAYAAGDFPQAAARYAAVLDKQPNSPLAQHALYGLAWSRLSGGEHAPAAETFTALIDRHRDSDLAPRARYGRAVARQQVGQFAAAAEDVQAFLATNPAEGQRSDALYVIGLCQAGLKKPAEAAATFQKILADDPDYSGRDKVRYELAWALKSADQPADAAAQFQKLASEHADGPYAAESLYHVGEFQYQKQQFDRAAEAFAAALVKAGESDLGEKAAHKLGWAQFRQDDFPAAGATFRKQRAQYPGGQLAADAAFMEAECLFHQQQWQPALDRYVDLPGLSGEDFPPLALLHAAQAASKLEKWQQALQLSQQCAADYPDTDRLPEVLYEQGWARQNLGQLDEAVQLYERVTELTGAEVAARARFMVGEIAFEQKEHSEAIRHFFKAAYGYAYPEWQANALYEAGRCFEVRQQTKQATQSYREIIEKFPDSDKADRARRRLAELGE